MVIFASDDYVISVLLYFEEQVDPHPEDI